MKLQHDTSKYKITKYGQISHMSFCTDKTGYPNVNQTVQRGVFENIESKLHGRAFIEIVETERGFVDNKPTHEIHKEVYLEGEEKRYKSIHDLIYSYDFGESLEYKETDNQSTPQ